MITHALIAMKRTIPDKIHIGQGFRGKGGDGVGIGNCTRGFIGAFEQNPPDTKSLGLSGVTAKNIADVLKMVYVEQTDE